MADTLDPSSADQMLAAMRVLVPPGAVVEMRIPEYGGRKTNTASGYFDDLEKFITFARADDGKAAGLYFTMNPVKAELLARRVNRSEQYAKLTTADHDIERRRWILIDIDPVRAAGICATDAQHNAAHIKAAEIEKYLAGLGFPEPVRMDSGNGAYLMYAVDLPNDAASLELVHTFLKALAARFDDETTEIDTSVANAARIMRVPGTVNAKGDHTPERPHRRTRLLHTPEELVTVSAETMALVAIPAQPKQPGSTSAGAAQDTADAATHNTNILIAQPAYLRCRRGCERLALGQSGDGSCCDSSGARLRVGLRDEFWLCSPVPFGSARVVHLRLGTLAAQSREA
jgi:hypothetical protein